jgi:hypothetical protein
LNFQAAIARKFAIDKVDIDSINVEGWIEPSVQFKYSWSSSESYLNGLGTSFEKIEDNVWEGSDDDDGITPQDAIDEDE